MSPTANVADSTVLPDLLHGRETRVWGDQAYRGQRAVIRRHAPRAQDFVNRRYRHRGVVDEVERAKNRTKSKVRPRACPRESGGRAFDRGHQAGVRLHQAALSRAQKERASPDRDLCAGQSVHGPPASAALPRGVVCPSHSNTRADRPTPPEGVPSLVCHRLRSSLRDPHPCAEPLFRRSLAAEGRPA
jgi:hypothetical protein